MLVQFSAGSHFRVSSSYQINGDAIYATQPWSKVQNQSDVSAFYTTKGKTLYAILVPWPNSHGECTVNVTLVAPKATGQAPIAATLLGPGSAVPVTLASGGGIVLTLPASDRLGTAVDPNGVVVALTNAL